LTPCAYDCEAGKQELAEADILGTKPLPKFERPPVVEVAISVFFRNLDGFRSAHFGSFWELNKDYPITEDVAPVIDSDGAGFELSQLPPLRRAFFITRSNDYLIQVQPDFFAHNWRKTKADDAYPSFERAKALFVEKWNLFTRFVSERKLGDLQLTRYEVTYVNHLVEEQAGAFPIAIEKYSPLLKLRQPTAGQFLPSPKSLLAELQFDIAKEKVLRVSLKQGVRATDQKEVMQLDLSARSTAQSDGSDMMEWLEIAHEWIVRGFTDLTSSEAHRLWSRTQ